MRWLCFGLVAVLVGCFESHRIEPSIDGFDVGMDVLDAGVIDARVDAPMDRPDARLDMGGVDTGVDAATPSEWTYDVPANRIYGARWGDEMSMVISFERRADAPVEVWTFDEPGPDLSIGAAQVVRGTEGADAAAASRWENLVAIAVERPAGPHEVLIFDLRTGRVIAQFVPEPRLTRPRVFHVFVAIDATRLLVVWLDPDSIIQFRAVSFADGGFVDLASGTAGTNSLSASVRLAAREPVVEEILRARLGAGFDVVADRPELGWVSDGESVSAYERGVLHVDAALEVGDAPRITSFYGRLGYARSDDLGIAGLATGDGMVAATFENADAASDGRWTAVETRFPAGPPVAHAGRGFRGLFFVEGAIGIQPARLRWVGL